MYKVSYVLAEQFNQDPLETYFWKQTTHGAWKDNLSFYDFRYANTFKNQKVLKAMTTDNVRDENIKFDSDRASSMS